MLDISYSDSNRVHAQLDNTGFFFLVWTRTGFICFFTAKGFCAAGVGEIWCLETGSESSRRHTFKLIKRAYGRESTACNARMLIYWKYTPPLVEFPSLNLELNSRVVRGCFRVQWLSPKINYLPHTTALRWMFTPCTPEFWGSTIDMEHSLELLWPFFVLLKTAKFQTYLSKTIYGILKAYLVTKHKYPSTQYQQPMLKFMY